MSLPLFVKVLPPGSYEYDEPPLALIKRSSCGVRGDDLSSLIKRSSHELVSRVRDMPMLPGEELIHLIAMGATEKTGCNKNGDGFFAADCRVDHPTFKKYARFYRQHRNKDPRISYGIVKDSCFNEAMQRIELIVGLNATKEAADRNNGLVADKELEKLARDEDVPVSMSCVLPFDICSGCNNKARSRAEYCDARMCKYGGLKENITKIAEDGHQLHAINRGCRHFDISHVGRQADRIAQTLGLLKLAGSNRVVSGAEMAELLGDIVNEDAIVSMLPQSNSKEARVVARLAEMEKAAATADSIVRRAVAVNSGSIGAVPTTGTIQEKLAALQNKQILLPLEQFVDLVLQREGAHREHCDAIAKAAASLPRGFTAMLASESFSDLLENNPYRATAQHPPALEKWANSLRNSYGIDASSLQRRFLTHAVRYNDSPPIKQASQDAASDVLARSYLLYQLSFVAAHSGASAGDQTSQAVIEMNRIR